MDLRDAKQPVIVIHEAPTHHAALRHDLISVSNMAEASGEIEEAKREEEGKKKRDRAKFFGRRLLTTRSPLDCFRSILSPRCISLLRVYAKI